MWFTIYELALQELDALEGTCGTKYPSSLPPGKITGRHCPQILNSLLKYDASYIQIQWRTLTVRLGK